MGITNNFVDVLNGDHGKTHDGDAFLACADCRHCWSDHDNPDDESQYGCGKYPLSRNPVTGEVKHVLCSAINIDARCKLWEPLNAPYGEVGSGIQRAKDIFYALQLVLVLLVAPFIAWSMQSPWLVAACFVVSGLFGTLSLLISRHIAKVREVQEQS